MGRKLNRKAIADQILRKGATIGKLADRYSVDKEQLISTIRQGYNRKTSRQLFKKAAENGERVM